MSIEMRPLGVQCNINCLYCYQNSQRCAGNTAQSYDIEVMKTAVEQCSPKARSGITLFGGEALLVPEADLENLWRWGQETNRCNGVQTNGTLVNDNHIRMFKEYKVSVGVSIDGPGNLNDYRWAGSLKQTRAFTNRTEATIEKLCGEGIPPGIIVTLHRGNATADKLDLMVSWFKRLDAIGIKSVRLHILEVESANIKQRYALTAQENSAALLCFCRLERDLESLRFDVFRDMRSLLIGRDEHMTCVWNGCDPYTTSSVLGIEGNGQSSNCGRVNKDGVEYIKANRAGFERCIALFYTPHEHLGCEGCRFFAMCKGQCPGTAIGGNWRNRTEDCEVWFSLFEYFEREMLAHHLLPLSASDIRPFIELELIRSYRDGKQFAIHRALHNIANNPDAVPLLQEFFSANGITYTSNMNGITHADHSDLNLAEIIAIGAPAVGGHCEYN